MLFAVAATTFVVWKTADDEIEWESANRTHNHTHHFNNSGGSAGSLNHHGLHIQSNNHSNNHSANHSSNHSSHGGRNSNNYLAPPWTMWMLGGR
jgi:hypothetical protein